MPPCRLEKILGIALAVGWLTSCSSSTTISPKPGTGNLITIVEDAPACNAISANVVIQNLTFTPVSGGAAAGYITTTPSFAPLIRLNLEQLRDVSTILYEFQVRAGSYSQANFDFELASLAAYDPTLSPPVKTYSTILSTNKPIVTLNPPLVITAGQANVMQLDFDVLSMLRVDSTGQLTGSMTPAIGVAQLTPTAATGYAHLDDLWGFVRSVTPNNLASTNGQFIGNFVLQLLSPSTANPPAVTMNLTANTSTLGFPDLNHLLPDTFVEVDASLDSQGNFVANTVEAQAVEDPFPTKSSITPSTALIGPIVSITTDQAGIPTQLNLWVRDAEPADISSILFDSIYQVNLTLNPTYQASALGPNFANLTYGPQNLAVGEEVVVHGAYTKVPTTVAGSTNPFSFTVAPSAIWLKLQSMQGTVGSLVQVGSDGLTGAFILTPCCTLLQGVPIYVLTNNQTTYVNVNGLGGLTPQAPVLVKGMPYYEPQASTINGVAIPAGTMVMQAKQVHGLTQ